MKLPQHGHKYYIKGGFVQKASAPWSTPCSPPSSDSNLPAIQAVVVPQGGGAVKRVKPNATAFAQRAAEHNVFVFNRWDDPALSEAIGNWARGMGEDRATHSSVSTSTNSTPTTPRRLRETYGVNFDRLVALKTKFDPDNLFRMNANVAPKART